MLHVLYIIFIIYLICVFANMFISVLGYKVMTKHIFSGSYGELDILLLIGTGFIGTFLLISCVINAMYKEYQWSFNGGKERHEQFEKEKIEFFNKEIKKAKIEQEKYIEHMIPYNDKFDKECKKIVKYWKKKKTEQ